MAETPQFICDEQLYVAPGTCVTIYKGRLLANNTPVAIKEQVFPSLTLANAAIQEALSMSQLTHASICAIYKWFIESTPTGDWKSVLLLELMESDLGKEAEKRQRNQDFWSDMELMEVLRQLVSALSYAQKLGISHRDIKPQNIFMSGARVKIGDFGSSGRSMADRFQLRSTIVGSPLFFSPEIKRKFVDFLQTGNKTDAVYDPYLSDVYSLGVTMLNLALCSPPVQLLDVDRLETTVDSLCSGLTMYPELSQWIRQMLVTDPLQRPSFLGMDAWLNPGSQTMEMTPSGQSQILYPLYQEQNGYVSDSQGLYNSGSTENLPYNQEIGQRVSMATREMPPVSTTFTCTLCNQSFIPGHNHPNFLFCSQQCGRKAKELAAKPCAACSSPILDKTWTNPFPPDMLGLEAFIGDYCSLDCFRVLGIYRCASCERRIYVKLRGRNYCYQCIQNFKDSLYDQ